MKQEEYNNYKLGALKRKFKTGKDDVEAGTFISKMNAQKAPRIAKTLPGNDTLRTAILGGI
jgi:hypothetical protein